MNKEKIFPMANNQKRLWIVRAMDPTETYYNVGFSVLIEGKLDINRFASACEQAVNQHEAFKMEFISEENVCIRERVACNVMIEQFPAHIKIVEQAAFSSEILEFLKHITDAPFHLQQAPLLRLHLFTVNPELAVFHVTLHHIICDASSFACFFQDITKYYIENEYQTTLKNSYHQEKFRLF
jgi:bacitracin synthase 2